MSVTLMSVTTCHLGVAAVSDGKDIGCVLNLEKLVDLAPRTLRSKHLQQVFDLAPRISRSEHLQQVQNTQEYYKLDGPNWEEA